MTDLLRHLGLLHPDQTYYDVDDPELFGYDPPVKEDIPYVWNDKLLDSLNIPLPQYTPAEPIPEGTIPQFIAGLQRGAGNIPESIATAAAGFAPDETGAKISALTDMSRVPNIYKRGFYVCFDS